MALSTVIKHLFDGSISVSDGTGTPVTLALLYTTGDLSITGLMETQNATVKYETRGSFHSARKAARTYATGSFTLQIADYSDATSQTAADMFLKQNSFLANESTLGANADVYTLDITLTVEGTNHGDAADHTIVMTDCDCTVDHSEGEPNTLTVSFEVLGTVAWT